MLTQLWQTKHCLESKAFSYNHKAVTPASLGIFKINNKNIFGILYQLEFKNNLQITM